MRPAAPVQRTRDEAPAAVHVAPRDARERAGPLVEVVEDEAEPLARALILRPKVLLLDEPLSSLDPALRDEMRSLIETNQARAFQGGVTVRRIT